MMLYKENYTQSLLYGTSYDHTTYPEPVRDVMLEGKNTGRKQAKFSTLCDYEIYVIHSQKLRKKALI